MKNLFTVIILLVFHSVACAQESPAPRYRNFPVVLSIQFHSFSLPFRNLRSNFANVGFGIGTEVSHNGKSNWVQQFTALWYRNRAIGNGLMFYTQTAWRPTLVSDVYSEVKVGVGYLYSFRPVESYRQVDGSWLSVGHKGKSMLAIPVGVSLGYDKPSSATYISPFIGYQFVLVKGYNESIPLVPETLVQVGSRIHLH
jgi:hypothetical protein